MGTTSYAHDNAAFTDYGRFVVNSTWTWNADGSQRWFRFFGNLLELQVAAGGSAGVQISVDGNAFTAVTTVVSGTPAWATAWTGSEGWHNVIISHPLGYGLNGGVIFNLAAFARITATGTEQIAIHPESGPYEKLGSAPFTTYGKTSYLSTDTGGGYSSPSALEVIVGTVIGSGASIRRKATWATGSRLYVWVANNGRGGQHGLKIDGINYGLYSDSTRNNSGNGWKWYDLPGSGSHEIEIHNVRVADAIMISDMVGGSGAYFESVATTAKTRKISILGDSQTEGAGVSPTGSQTLTFDSLASQICDFNAYNVGIAGNATANLTARFTTDVTSHSPTHLLIHAGYNDAPGATFETDYKALLDKAILDLPSLAYIFCLKINDSWGTAAGLNTSIDTAVAAWLAINTTWANKLIVIQNDPAGITTDVQNGHISGAGYAQMHGDNTAVIRFTAQPSDADTITLTANAVTKVFEFDNNASVTGGNVAVTIGATATDTNYNLFLAMVSQFEGGFAGKPLVRINDTYTVGCAVSKVSAASKSGANIALTGPFSSGVATTLQSYVGAWPIEGGSKNVLLLGVG